MDLDKKLAACVLWLARNDATFNGDIPKSDLADHMTVIMLCEVFGAREALEDNGSATAEQCEALAGAIIEASERDL